MPHINRGHYFNGTAGEDGVDQALSDISQIAAFVAPRYGVDEDDLTGEVILKVFQSPPPTSIQSPEQMTGWLCTVTTNKARDMAGKRASLKVRIQKHKENKQTTESPSAMEVVSEKEQRAKVLSNRRPDAVSKKHWSIWRAFLADVSQNKLAEIHCMEVYSIRRIIKKVAREMGGNDGGCCQPLGRA